VLETVPGFSKKELRSAENMQTKYHTVDSRCRFYLPVLKIQYNQLNINA